MTNGDLPDGDVTVDISHSSLNFKDGLAVTGKGRVVRRFPLTCGIDLAGVVTHSQAADWAVGERVVVTGWGLSETHPGGYSERQRVRSEWLVRKPPEFTSGQAMAAGTAGLTAMLCVLALERAGVTPADGEVLVTGAAGGVGSVATAILGKLGYRVTGSTGRPELEGYLLGLGASSVIARDELARVPERPLERERWAAAIDTVGGTTLSSVISQMAYGGRVAACGLAGGRDLPASVLPFILRGVSLLGVDSVYCPAHLRNQAWRRLTSDLPGETLDALSVTHTLDEVPALARDILAGLIRGRIVIDIAAQD